MADLNFPCAVGAFALTIADTIKVDGGLTVATGSLAVGGQAANFRHLYCAPGSHTLSGVAAALSRGRTLSCAAGSFALTIADTITVDGGLELETGYIGLDGRPATFRSARKVAAVTGATALTGGTATLTRGRRLFCQNGAYSRSPLAFTMLTRGRTLDTAGGAFTLSGVSADRRLAKRLSVSTGAFIVDGGDALSARRMAAVAGSYAYLGKDAVIGNDRKLVADAASFAVSGQAVGLRAGRKMTAAVGARVLSGVAATYRVTRNVQAVAGVYVLTTPDAAFPSGLTLPAVGGSYALAIADRITADRGLSAATGVLALSGVASLRKVKRTAAVGSFALSGQAETSILGRKIIAASGGYSVQGVAERNSQRRTAGGGAFVVIGKAAERGEVGSGYSPFAVATGAFTLSLADQITADRGLSLDTVPVALVGRPVLLNDTGLFAASGSYSIVGATSTSDRVLFVNSGAFTVTGRAAAVGNRGLALLGGEYVLSIADRITIGDGIACATGVYSRVGKEIFYRRSADKKLPADPGSYISVGATATRDLELRFASRAFVYTGRDAALRKAGRRIGAETGTFAWNIADVITSDVGINCSPGSYGVAGPVIDLRKLGLKLSCESGSYALTGGEAMRSLARNAAPGPHVLTGRATALRRGLLLGAEAGAYASTGSEVSFAKTRRLALATGVHSLSGVQATGRRNRTVSPLTGLYSREGLDAGLIRGRVMASAPGGHSLSGGPALRHLSRAAAGRAFALDGPQVALEIKGAKEIAANPRAFALNGLPAGLRASLRGVCSAGSYTLSGKPADLSRARAVISAAGPFTINGKPATFRLTRVLSAEPGAYAVNGGEVAEARRSYSLALALGGYVLIGKAVFLPDHFLRPGSASYALNGGAAAFRRRFRITAAKGVYATTIGKARLKAPAKGHKGNSIVRPVQRVRSLINSDKRGRIITSAQFRTRAIARQP